MTAATIDIRVDDLTSPDILALIAFHLNDMRGTGPAESVHALDAAGLQDPAITVWSGRIDGELAGMAALFRLDPDRGEIKSMRVDDRFRGSGVGRALLGHLIDEACAAGIRSLWLETGSSPEFTAAHRLYASEGFTQCPPFDGYADDPHSIFMTRAL
ncbi:GNAT family N-acetyltransferase [Microbacterium sp. CJ88]|uniref:GNAT family N-acetyltransferase n=1 Tax=Microbacterium sp. CJ88 TaxID=3445672 RepID=UPI003F659080